MHRELREGRRFEPCQVHFAIFLIYRALFRMLTARTSVFLRRKCSKGGTGIVLGSLLCLLQRIFVIMVGVQHSPSNYVVTQVSIYRWTSSGYYCTRKKSRFITRAVSKANSCPHCTAIANAAKQVSPPSGLPASIRTSSGTRRDPP